MLTRLALRTLRARRSGFLGAFVALFCAAALITACGGLLETGLSGTIATERYAAAPRDPGACSRIDRPRAGASAKRIDFGTCGSRTSIP